MGAAAVVTRMPDLKAVTATPLRRLSGAPLGRVGIRALP